MNERPSDQEKEAEKLEHNPLESKLLEKAPKLYQRFKKIQEYVIEQFASRQQKLEDTDSAMGHLSSVHRNLNRLVPSTIIDQYNAIEIFVLLVAVYLHDIGKMQQRTPENQHHSSTGRDLVVEHASKLDLQEAEALAIGHVIQGHGPEDISCLPELKGVAPYGAIHIRYLAALLSLADDLDMTYTRASRIVRDIVKPGPEINTKWDLRRCVDEVLINPQHWTIEVQATPRTSADHDALMREVEIINARLTSGRMFLRANPEVGLYYSVVEPNVDYYLMKRNSEQKVTTVSVEQTSITEDETLTIPSNTAVVLLRYDSVSLALFKDIIEPCLKNGGLSPLLIENLLPDNSILDRTTQALDKASLVIALLAGGGGPSVHFRLGVAAGLRKQILAFTTSGTTTIGDLCGLRIRIYDNSEDLHNQLTFEVAEHMKTVHQQLADHAVTSRN